MKFKKTISTRLRASVENSPSLSRTLDCSAIGSDLHEVCVKTQSIHLSYHKVGVFLCAHLHTSDEKSRSSKYPKKCPPPLIVPLSQECEHVLGGFMSSKAPNSPPLAPTLMHLSYHKVGVFLYAHRGQPCVAAWPGSPPVARAGSLTEGETNTVKS